MFLFPFLEKSKKLLKWTGEHLTTTVNLDEHGATRNTIKAWRIAAFLYIGEHRWQMFNGSPKRKAVSSNLARDASKYAENLWFIKVFGFSYFCRFVGFFTENLSLLTFANGIVPFVKKGGKSGVRVFQKSLLTKKCLVTVPMWSKRRIPLTKWEVRLSKNPY